MKIREAIDIVKIIREHIESPTKEVKEGLAITALTGAIEALEKQLPKKTKQRGVTTKDGVFHPIIGIDGVPYDLCPNCETNLCTNGILGRSKKYMKYCESCGQRLDW